MRPSKQLSDNVSRGVEVGTSVTHAQLSPRREQILHPSLIFSSNNFYERLLVLLLFTDKEHDACDAKSTTPSLIQIFLRWAFFQVTKMHFAATPLLHQYIYCLASFLHWYSCFPSRVNWGCHSESSLEAPPTVLHIKGILILIVLLVQIAPNTAQCTLVGPQQHTSTPAKYEVDLMNGSQHIWRKEIICFTVR